MVESIGYNLLMLARVSLAFLVLYIVVPTLITRVDAPANGIWDRMFAGLTHATCLTIVIVHVLVFCRLYETFSLLFAYALVLFLWQRARNRAAPAGAGMGVVVRLLDASESRLGFVWGLSALLKQWLSGWSARWSALWRKLSREPFLFFLPAVLLLGSAWIRLSHSLNHAAYSLSDSYEHLAWVKYLGSNQIYADGIYPEGYHAIISALAKLSFIDPYWLIRFFGGVGTSVLVAAIFYFTLRLTRSHAAGLVALAVYGLVSDVRFPSGLVRQTAALPQEYSLIFGLSAIYFLSLWLEHRRFGHLLVFLEATAITVFIHPYTTIYLVVWSVIVTGLHLLLGRTGLKPALQAGLLGAVAAALGTVPMLVGRLLGKPWFGAATQFVLDSIGRSGAPPTESWWLRLLSVNPYLNLLLPLCLLAWLGALIDRASQRVRLLSTTAIALVMLALYRATELGLPELSEQSRTGVFLAPWLAITAGIGVASLGTLLSAGHRPWMARISKGLALAACAAIVVYATPDLPQAESVEYDAAAFNYLRIKTEFPVMDWTVIGPAEQFQQVLGIGWHYDLLRFVQDFSLENAADSDFRLPIPTHHIFFYIERESLLDQARVEDADISRQLEPEGPDPYTQYYRSADQRHLLQSKAWHWVETYRQTHPGVTIFYDDGQLLVYHIMHQPPEEPASGEAGEAKE